MDFSRPGKPTDNAMVESFNGRLRQECLNYHWFMNLQDAQDKIEAWRGHHNNRKRDEAAQCTKLDVAQRIRSKQPG